MAPCFFQTTGGTIAKRMDVARIFLVISKINCRMIPKDRPACSGGHCLPRGHGQEDGKTVSWKQWLDRCGRFCLLGDFCPERSPSGCLPGRSGTGFCRMLAGAGQTERGIFMVRPGCRGFAGWNSAAADLLGRMILRTTGMQVSGPGVAGSGYSQVRMCFCPVSQYPLCTCKSGCGRLAAYDQGREDEGTAAKPVGPPY